MKKLIGSLLFMGLSCAVRADMPHEVGSGGDAYAAEFVRIGKEIVENLMHEPVAGVDTNAFYAAVKGTKVISQETLTLNGEEVGAINYRYANPPRIEVSRTHWNSLKDKMHNKVFLTMHEYLGILGVDDTNYQVSSRLDRALVCNRTEVVRSQIEKTLKKSCYRILVDDLRYVQQLNITDNELNSLKPTDLWGMDGLAYLHLYSLKLSKLPKEIFQGASNLRLVHITAPQLELSENNFEGLGNPQQISEEYPGYNLFRLVVYAKKVGDRTFANLNPGAGQEFQLEVEYAEHISKDAFLGIPNGWKSIAFKGISFEKYEEGFIKQMCDRDNVILDYGQAFNGYWSGSKLRDSQVREIELSRVKALGLGTISASDLVGSDLLNPKRLKGFVCKYMVSGPANLECVRK